MSTSYLIQCGRAQWGPAAPWGQGGLWAWGLSWGGQCRAWQPGLVPLPQPEAWGAAPALSTGHLPGVRDTPRSGWDVSLQVGVRIRPGEGNLGQTQHRGGPAGPRGWRWDETGPGVGRRVKVLARPGHGCSQLRLRPHLTAQV